MLYNAQRANPRCSGWWRPPAKDNKIPVVGVSETEPADTNISSG